LLDAIDNNPIKYSFIKDEDGSYFTSNNVLPDIIGFGSSEKEALLSFNEALIAFGRFYMDQFDMMIHAPNRQHQVLIALRIFVHTQTYRNVDRLLKRI